jgi:hypothetical protein
MKTLLLWSGGTDSTYLLNKLLTETSDEVTAVTITGEGFAGAESAPESLKNIEPLRGELLKVRSFDHLFVTSADMTSGDGWIDRHYYTRFVSYAAPKLNDGTYDRITSGRTWEQHDQTVIKEINMRGMPATYAARRLFKNMTTRGELWEPLITHEFDANFCKYHTLVCLPANLRDLTVSCHYSSYEDGKYVACGKCYKCLWDRKVAELVGQGYGERQINFYRRMRSLQYGGGNNLSAPMRAWLPVEMNEQPYRGLDTKQKVQVNTQTGTHYSLAITSDPENIWNMSTLTADEAIDTSDINPPIPALT